MPDPNRNPRILPRYKWVPFTVEFPAPLGKLLKPTDHSGGKSGGVRTLIAFKDGDKAFFMFGFAKNERASIKDDELKALKVMAKTLFDKSAKKLKIDIDKKILIEVKR